MTLTATRHPDHRPARLYPNTTATYSHRVDWIAVELAANGEHPNPADLTQPEREAAWRLLLDHGHTVTEAARRTGCAYDRVRTWARAHGYLPGAVPKAAA